LPSGGARNLIHSEAHGLWAGRRRRLAGVLLVAALAVAGAAALDAGAGVWPPWAAEDSREPFYPEITATVEGLSGSLGSRDLVVVDARPAAAYREGHLPTAVSIPAADVPDPIESAAFLAARGLSGRERIVCYGEGSYTPDAATLFWLLEVAGAERVSILDGGVSAWRAAGRALDREARVLPEAVWEAQPRPDRLATTAYVALKFGEPGHEIVDVRGWEEWEGGRPAEGAGAADEAERPGHIPHALPYDFRQLLLPDGRLAPAEDAREILAALGPRPSTPVDLWDEFIVYDDGASREGTIGYFLLRRSGVDVVRYYPGGWAAWAADPGLPMVRIIHAAELERMLAGARSWFRPSAGPSTFALFDVRHRTDFDRGHIPGAVNLTSRFFADSLDVYVERRWPDLDRSVAPIVTYCYGSNCIRSRDCSTIAARRGFINVDRLYGGIEEWRGIGGRIVTTP
jgi:thiosulfate/3-mercaptopyruvate sulfurtransferase